MDYNERYEEAKRLYQNANNDQKYVLESLFPELKESEDERIRKTLIEYFNAYPKDYFGGLKKSYLLAWLEKQGEEDKIEALRTEYEKGRADVITKIKSSWSEEDEKMCKNILECLRNGWKKLPTDILMYESWVKSLRPQNTWKPTKEQMYMLEWLTTNVLDDGVVGNKAKEVLNTLIEQLKSL